MKRIYLILIMLSFALITCQKNDNNFDKKVSVDILSCTQDEYSEWGYHDSVDTWHHVLSPFALDTTTGLPDTIFSSITGEIIIVVGDTVYVQVGDTIIKIEHRIAYGTADVKYEIINNSPFQVNYYEFIIGVTMADCSYMEHNSNGAGLPAKTSFIETAYIETKNKKIINLSIMNLKLE